jgi:hypothetical protein
MSHEMIFIPFSDGNIQKNEKDTNPGIASSISIIIRMFYNYLFINNNKKNSNHFPVSVDEIKQKKNCY